MRRQTMKQPSGPATRATPMPASRARRKKSSSMAVLCGVLVLVAPQHLAVRQVRVVVMVLIDGQGGSGARAEQRQILGTARDEVRRAAAADVAVEADHSVGRRHH